MKTDDWHSPLPYIAANSDYGFVYSLNAAGSNRFSASINAGFDDDGFKISEKECKATAAFICRAVNSHADLVAALEKALARYTPSFSHPGTDKTPTQLPDPEWVIDARAALSKAKE